ncbi:MAG: hypothetical protein KAG61_13860 [Bacteriovoracaceae bacterium]|nr:hypothetical protein [Bacteriovoracaceae bacterium]
MLKALITISLLFFLSSASAITQININIINRKGIDNNLVLTNEHHSANFYEQGKPIVINMKNGIRVELKLLVKKSKGKPFFEIDGVVQEGKRIIAKLDEINDSKLFYNVKKKFTLEDNNEQVIEISITAIDLRKRK